MLKDSNYPWWLLIAVIVGDGAFVVLQVPSPSFFGFGLTPFPLLIAETLTYLIAGYLAYKLRIYSIKLVYFISFGVCVVSCFALAFLPLPEPAALTLQMLVYGTLALLNLCWGVCFASFKPAISMVLVVGSYVLWSFFSLCISLVIALPIGEVLQVGFPLVSLVILGFCLANLDFGREQKKFEPEEQQAGFFEIIKSVGFYVAATLAFAFIFGSIMQIDIIQGYEGFIVAPEAQIATIAASLAMLVYALRGTGQIKYWVLIIVPLVLATILMARAMLESQSFFTSGLPMALFNFFGQIVWIVFAWKGYESKANSFTIFALGLGSMRLGLLGGRGFSVLLSDSVGLSPAVANGVSIVGLWVLFIGVLAAVFYVLRRQASEQLPFEAETEAGIDPTGSGSAIKGEDESGFTDSGEAQMAKAQALYEERFAEAVKGSGLTEREQEILGMYASGRSATYIAEELFLSNYTVKTHLRRCYAKLNVHSRQELLDLIWKGSLPPA